MKASCIYQHHSLSVTLVNHVLCPADTLSWPTNTAIPFEQYVHLHSLAEPALLKALVQRALPATTAGSNASVDMTVTVHSLCQMLQALTGVSALCQKALIFTAHQADFVRRLWFSYLQVRCTSYTTQGIHPSFALLTVTWFFSLRLTLYYAESCLHTADKGALVTRPPLEAGQLTVADPWLIVADPLLVAQHFAPSLLHTAQLLCPDVPQPLSSSAHMAVKHTADCIIAPMLHTGSLGQWQVDT